MVSFDVRCQSGILRSYNTSMHEVCKHDIREWSVYKSDTNQMGMLQLLCSIVREWIKSALSLCSLLSVLYTVASALLLVLCTVWNQ